MGEGMAGKLGGGFPSQILCTHGKELPKATRSAIQLSQDNKTTLL